MLHFRQQDDITRAKKFPAPRLRHQIDAFGRPAGEDDLVGRRSADVFRDVLAGSFVSFRRARAQLMQAAMHVGVVMLVVIPQRIQHRLRLLRCRGAVEVDQGMAVGPLAQDREILAHSLPIYAAAGHLVHSLICSTRRRAPLDSPG